MKKLALLLTFLPIIAFADWQGIVVGISDGDTLTVLNQQKKTTKIRLIEIDAPEKNQAFGQQAKKTLSDLCYKQTAEIADKGLDKYKRTLARVKCRGLDANAEMVKRGMAWAYLKYLTDPHIAELEKAAKVQKIGLWSDSNALPPWEFRHPKVNISSPTPTRLTAIPASETFSCSGKNARCKSMRSCAEAMDYLKKCGAKKLDRDGDGIPCENLCN